MKIAIGVLCYSRPMHTALTLSFLFANKSPGAEVHLFYGVPEGAEHKSLLLLRLITRLAEAGLAQLHRLPVDAAHCAGANMDNLIHTLDERQELDCFLKMDDDVLIGPGVDVDLASKLLCKDLREENVLVLAAQAVKQHMRGPSPFGWRASFGGTEFACRESGYSPMETLVAISPGLLPHLREHGYPTRCSTRSGHFGAYSKRLWESGGKAALILRPSPIMQHVGINCSTGAAADGVQRDWAPARRWDPAGEIIQVPYFDFDDWETALKAGSERDYTLKVVETMRGVRDLEALELIDETLTGFGFQK